MQWTDEQIMLLEQLTYLPDAVYTDAGISPSTITSVSDLANWFTEDSLRDLENSGENYGMETTAAEWAAIIRAIKADEQLCELKVKTESSLGVMCFNHPDEPEKAIVAFQGTLDGNEWKDNFFGLYETDTECQRKALEYIENLPYDSITVTGHSKGGNKAQYVTILSDKVDRCVSMDGQGFSAEFLEKYAYEIEQKGGCITNYYLENDFVNILLFPVPNSGQVCVDGGEIKREDFGKHHSPGAFFQYYKDKNGNYYIQVDEEGNALLKLTTQGEIMELAHQFTCFIENVMPEDKQKEVALYLGTFVALLRDTKGIPLEYKGKEYTKATALQLLYSDPETLAIVIAYFLKFIDTYKLSEAEIDSLASILGLSHLAEMAEIALEEYPNFAAMLEKAGGSIWTLFIQQLNDKDSDLGIRALLAILVTILNVFKKAGIEIDTNVLWVSIQEEYQAIPGFDPATACDIQQTRGTKIRDFSEQVYNKLVQCIGAIGANTYGSVSSWRGFEEEDWYDSLFISKAVRGINQYFERVYDVNTEAKTRVEIVFRDVQSIDAKSASKIQSYSQRASKIAREINEIANRLR